MISHPRKREIVRDLKNMVEHANIIARSIDQFPDDPYFPAALNAQLARIETVRKELYSISNNPPPLTELIKYIYRDHYEQPAADKS